MKFGNFDLEQADARNVGAICWNLGLPDIESCGTYLDACEAADLHTTVCKIVWPELPWTSDERKNRELCDDRANPFHHSYTHRDCAKRTGHGVNYLGLSNVAKATGIPLATLEWFRSRYFAAFPCIPEWHKWVRAQLKGPHQITTLMGRRRYFYGRYDDDNTVREAVAYEPQSVTADIVNTGLLNVWRANLPGVQILAQVHDSILIQYPEDLERDIIPQVLSLMRVPINLSRGRTFVIPCEAKVGYNWGDQAGDNPDGLRKWS